MLVSLHEIKFINIKSFLRYVLYKIKKEAKQTLYKSYVANCLQGIVTNTARFSGGTVVNKSYKETVQKIDDVDIFVPKKANTSKPLTAEQIIAGVMARGGLKLSRKKGG